MLARILGGTREMLLPKWEMGMIRVELRVTSFPSCSYRTYRQIQIIAWRMEH